MRAVWKLVPRLNRLCTTGASAQSSDSNTVPGASNTPTTRQVWAPKRMVLPISKPANSRNRPAPTTISFEPGANIRPSRIRTWLRTARPLGPIPRRGILALVSEDFLIPSTTSISSAEIMGVPSVPSLMLGPLARRSIWSRPITLFNSDPDPSRSTITTFGEPDPLSVWLKPLARAKKPSKTATTSAIDTTEATDIHSLCGMERTFIIMTEPVWLIRLMARLPIADPRRR